MTAKQKLKWEKVKAKGKLRFVLMNAFAFGFGFALSATFREFFWKSNSDTGFWNIFTLISFSFILPAFCAALGALWYWERCEKEEKENGREI